MEELKLVLPTAEYKTQIEKYKQDMLDAGSSMDGCGSLRNDDFETWLKNVVTGKRAKICQKDMFLPHNIFVLENRIIKLLECFK